MDARKERCYERRTFVIILLFFFVVRSGKGEGRGDSVGSGMQLAIDTDLLAEQIDSYFIEQFEMIVF